MARILIAAPASGSGKTTLTCGLIECCIQRGLRVAAMKCGPDYIDPMFHRSVLGVPSGNLDTFFTDADTTRSILAQRMEGADITILEGVMGYYDGLGGVSEKASTSEIASITETPVLLVVNAKGAGLSLAASLHGILDFHPYGRMIRGIILNRVSASYYAVIREKIEQELKIPVVGFIPDQKTLEIPSRHLGLFAPEELGEKEDTFKARIRETAVQLEKSLDMEKILQIAEEAPSLKVSENEGIGQSLKESKNEKELRLSLKEPLRIAVARDEAFSFHYEENEDLLRSLGAEIRYFSPLHDEKLPEDSDGLILGGGYPERFAGELEGAEQMRREIRAAINAGMPVIAECGGFLYLQQSLEGEDGQKYEMTGVLQGHGFRTDRLQRFGYIEAATDRAGLFGESGMHIRGHEFHYWDCTENGEDLELTKPFSGRKSRAGVYTETLTAGFPHFYWPSNPEAVCSFLRTCLEYRSRRLARKRWDKIAKPIDGLGILEQDISRICGVYRSPSGENLMQRLQKRAIAVFCGDHGVTCEGVTQTGSEVTAAAAHNIARGNSSLGKMAAQARADIFVVDVGIASYVDANRSDILIDLKPGRIYRRKAAHGTENLLRKAAMTDEQCREAIETGINVAKDLAEQGYGILAAGEMGIGNTTSAAVLTALLLGLDENEVTGRGAGLSDEKLSRKIEVVRSAAERIRTCITDQKDAELCTDPNTTFRILCEGGGFEIAAMAGLFIGGAKYGVPVIIDGAVSAAAAVIAARLDARVRTNCIASHVSRERSAQALLAELGQTAPITADLALGEGTGAALLLPMLDQAAAVYAQMPTFEEYGITAYQRAKKK